MSEIRLEAHAANSSPRCPYCHSDIEGASVAWECPACHTAHHEACVRENGKCTVLGCGVSFTPPSPFTAPALAPPRAATVLPPSRLEHPLRARAERPTVSLRGLPVMLGTAGALGLITVVWASCATGPWAAAFLSSPLRTWALPLSIAAMFVGAGLEALRRALADAEASSRRGRRS